jgi:hypothetical protein
MALQPIGIVIFLIGVMCVVFGRRLAIFAFFPVTLLGASAVAFLPLLGNANLPPAHFLLAFLSAYLLLRPRLLRIGLTSLAINRAGFWLLLTVAYGVAAAILMPRIFAGATDVFNIAQLGSGGAGVIQVPLAPVTANVTQSLYFIGGLICFIIFFAYASDRRGVDSVARAVIACAFVNLGFATIDVASHFGTPDLMSFVRNANYRIMGDTEIAGFKRIIGSFAEASAFSYATLLLFAFTTVLWMRGVYPAAAGLAAVLSLIALAFATSTTGYFGLIVFLSILYVYTLFQVLHGNATRNSFIFLVFAPICLGLFVSFIILNPSMQHAIQQLADETVLNKFDSESGLERAAWNRQALAAFYDTKWLGAGIGSVRASSWPIAVLSNIGVFGAITYGIFVLMVQLGRTNVTADAHCRAIQSAARASCLVQIIASSVSASFIDLGLPFFALAGVACASPMADREVVAAKLSSGAPFRRPTLNWT